MANLSDANGRITVEKVGKEFLEFLKAVQGTEDQAYYKLVEIDNFLGIIPNTDNTLSFNFYTSGRWNYESNIKGYLDGAWLHEPPMRKAYDKFLAALVEKDGKVIVEYQDSDAAMGWLGQGGAILQVIDGHPDLEYSFEEGDYNIESFGKMTDRDDFEALEYMYGDEAAEEYSQYLDSTDNPVSAQEWLDEIYEG